MLILGASGCGGSTKTVTVTQTVSQAGIGQSGDDFEPARAGIEGSDSVTGYVDRVEKRGDLLVLFGWAAAANLSDAAARVTASSGGREVTSDIPSIQRKDVVEAFEEKRIKTSGFELKLPIERLECDAPIVGIVVTATAHGKTGPLKFSEGIEGAIDETC